MVYLTILDLPPGGVANAWFCVSLLYNNKIIDIKVEQGQLYKLDYDLNII